jgi:hypothetical protein
VVELLIVSAFMAFIALLLSQTWSSLGKSAVDLATRGRINQEANLAAAALTYDLGGSLANPEGRIGTQTQYRWVGRLQPANSELWLCFDGGPAPNGVADWGAPDTVIVYQVQSRQLIRTDQTAGTSVVVARDVDAFAVSDLGDRVQIQLTFKYRNLTRTYTMIARDP